MNKKNEPLLLTYINIKEKLKVEARNFFFLFECVRGAATLIVVMIMTGGRWIRSHLPVIIAEEAKDATGTQSYSMITANVRVIATDVSTQVQPSFEF